MRMVHTARCAPPAWDEHSSEAPPRLWSAEDVECLHVSPQGPGDKGHLLPEQKASAGLHRARPRAGGGQRSPGPLPASACPPWPQADGSALSALGLALPGLALRWPCLPRVPEHSPAALRPGDSSSVLQLLPWRRLAPSLVSLTLAGARERAPYPSPFSPSTSTSPASIRCHPL